MIYLRLFFEFFKTGLFAFGGGMATVPFLAEMAERTGWFTAELLTDMIAVGESTPGPIGVNTATYVGYTVAGIPGGVIATLGLAAPSVLIILLVARALKAYRDNRFVRSALYAIRPASLGLISAAGWTVLKLCVWNGASGNNGDGLLALMNWKGLLLGAAVWGCTNVFRSAKKLHPAVWIAASALIGVIFRFAGV